MIKQDILRKTQSAITKVVEEARNKKIAEGQQQLISSINATLGPLLIPYLQQMIQSSNATQAELRKMVADTSIQLARAIKESLTSMKLESIVHDIKLPKIDTPTVNIPDVNVSIDTASIERAINNAFARVKIPTPNVNVPPLVMPDRMNTELGSVDRRNPLPVRLMDGDGQPFVFTMPGSGKRDYTIIKDIRTSSGTSIIDSEEDAIRVTGALSATFAGSSLAANLVTTEDIPYNGDNPLPVDVTGFSGSIAASIIDSDGVQYSGSNPIPVTITAGAAATSAANIVDSTGVVFAGANPLPVYEAAQSVYSTGVNILDSSGVAYSGSNPFRSIIVDPTGAELDLFKQGDNFAVGSDHGVGILGLSDGIPQQYAFVRVEGVDGDAETPLTAGAMSTESYLMGYQSDNDEWNRLRTGKGYDSPGVLRVVHATDVGTSVNVTGFDTSIAASLIDSGGVGYSGSNPVPVYNVAGAVSSVVAVGPTASDSADNDSAPVKVGGIARTANPTAVQAGDAVSATYDDTGRQVMKVHQVRDLLKTAYVTEDEVGEVVLLAGVAGEFHDLVYVLCANESDAAINLDFRQTTGGTVQLSVEVPANGTAGVSLPIPIPQDHADATWTVQNSATDNSTTWYSVTALFSKEV